VSGFRQDLAFAVRSLLRSPGFATVAILSLGLGIAANTTIFSVSDGFIFRPLPFPDSDRLVEVWLTNPAEGWDEMSLSVVAAEAFKEAPSLQSSAVFTEQGFNLSGTDRPDRVIGARVEHEFFALLGFDALRGRLFAPDEDGPGGARVAVLSERLWERRFGRDPSTVGAQVRLDGVPYTVIGIAPTALKIPSLETDLWIPFIPDSAEMDPATRPLALLARIRPDRTIDDLSPEVEAIASRLGGTHGVYAGLGGRVETLENDMYGPEFHRAIMILMLTVLFVLLIACANLANLLLARATGRQREIAVRAALGAGRGRLARQLLTESVLLAFLGGALGVVLSIWGIDALVSVIPADAPRVDEIALNGRALAYTAFLCVMSGIVFGLAPAIQATRPDLAGSLKEGGARGATTGRARSRLRSALVVAEVALALVLLVCAGIMIKGYRTIYSGDPGFDARGVLTMWIELPELKYADDAAVLGFQERLIDEARQLPGVEEAMLGTGLPQGGSTARPVAIVGRALPPSGQKPMIFTKTITPGYFETFRVPIVEGRALDERDREAGRPVALVNQAFAREHFPDESPVGRMIELEGVTREIVGVAADTRDWGMDEEAPVSGYLPYRQEPSRGMFLALRTPADSARVAPAVQAMVARLDPDQPISAIRTMEQIVDDFASGERIMSQLLGIFAALALILAAVGVYGVMAYSVGQRTHEIGIRAALGAEARDIRRMVLRQGLTIGGIGIAIGLLAAAGATRFLGYFLLGVNPLDPWTFGGVSAVLLATVLVASWIPARRATRVEPTVALRYE
jgi:putative ABC transport system permease protein